MLRALHNAVCVLRQNEFVNINNFILPVPVVAPSKAYVCGFYLVGIAGSSPVGDMDACRECFVLSGRGPCDGPMTRPEEFYRLWCVVECDTE